MLRLHPEGPTSSHDNNDDSGIDASSNVQQQPIPLRGLNPIEVDHRNVTKFSMPKNKNRELTLITLTQKKN